MSRPRSAQNGAARRLLRVFLGAFGEPGHAFPMLALGAELAARGHDVTYETWSRWREHIEGHGMRFVAAPENNVSDPAAPRGPYESVVAATEPTRFIHAAGERQDRCLRRVVFVAMNKNPGQGGSP